MNNQNDSFDPARKTKISTIAVLRAVVAGYLFYLGFTILRDLLQGGASPAGTPGSLPPWLLWLCGILFILAALAFGWYTWKQYQKQMSALNSESSQEPQTEAPTDNKQ